RWPPTRKPWSSTGSSDPRFGRGGGAICSRCPQCWVIRCRNGELSTDTPFCGGVHPSDLVSVPSVLQRPRDRNSMAAISGAPPASAHPASAHPGAGASRVAYDVVTALDPLLRDA